MNAFKLLKDRFPYLQRKLFTVLFVVDPSRGRILMGHKKRGFGNGLWNGYGGKVEIGRDESVCAAARRELHEESGIKLCREPRLRGIVYFEFDVSDADKLFEVHVFDAQWQEEEYTDQLQETDEMQPKWFHMNEIPFENMWQDDEIWFPHLLEPWERKEEREARPAGLFRGYFRFAKNFGEIEDSELEVVENVDELRADNTFNAQTLSKAQNATNQE